MLPSILAWGLVARGLGLVYAISFLSIAVQIKSLVGRRGVSPFAATLRQIAHDFPGARRHVHFPSIFWLTGTSDVALVAVPLVGALSGLCWALGAQTAMGEAPVICWLAMRSLDLPVGLLYPWDSLLLEAGALALLLPPTTPCWAMLTASGAGSGGAGASFDAVTASLALRTAPHPWLTASFRWLVVRLLLGFGKKKFVGTSSRHSCYIKNFLVAQPLPSPLGWLACRLPLPIFQLALVVMFITECILPLLLLPVGMGRAIAAAAIAALMAGIQAGGNFGHFNVLTAVLCIGGLDTTSSVFDPLPPAASLLSAEIATRLVLGLHGSLSLIFLPFDSWCSTSFAYWPQLAIARKPVVRMLLALCRAASDHRILHAYGVFPPDSNPPIRMAPALEGSYDGRVWRRYVWRYLPSDPSSRPRFVAPHHPRLDHALFYASFGTSPDNFLATINAARPYAFGRASTLHRLADVLLRGASNDVRRLFRVDPFPSDAGPPPTYVRVRLMGYEPTAVSTAKGDGVYWTERCLDSLHVPPMRLPPHSNDGGLLSSPSADDDATNGDRNGGGGAVRRRRRTSGDRLGAGAASPTTTASGLHGGAGAAVVSRAGPLAPPLAPGSKDPLLFHPDLLVVWRHRSPKLRHLLSSPLPSGKDGATTLARLAVADYAGHSGTTSGAPLDAASLTKRFWADFVPAVSAACTLREWGQRGGLIGCAECVRVGYSRAELHGFELILGAYTLRLLPLLEAMHIDRALPALGGAAPSYLHLVLLAHALVLRGAEAVGALLDDTGGRGRALAAKVPLQELTERGLALYGVFWPETLTSHARSHVVAWKMMRQYADAPLRPRHPMLIPGFLSLMPLLAETLAQDVATGHECGFPQWEPPPPWGDWRRLKQ